MKPNTANHQRNANQNPEIRITPVRMVTIKKTTNNKFVENVKKEPLCTCKLGAATKKTVQRLFKKLKTELSLGKEKQSLQKIHPSTYCSIIYSS